MLAPISARLHFLKGTGRFHGELVKPQAELVNCRAELVKL